MTYIAVQLNKKFNYKLSSFLEFKKSFVWNLGAGRQYWYQVTGCCKHTSAIEGDSEREITDVCPPMDDGQKCLSKSSYFQVILSDSIDNVCKSLKDNNWNWKICEIKRWSRPAENIYNNDFCNVLEGVEWRDTLECLTLSIDQSLIEIINFSSTAKLICGPSQNCFVDSLLQSLEPNVFASLSGPNPDSDSDLNIDFSVNENLMFNFSVLINDFIVSEYISTDYSPASFTVNTACKDCSPLPSTLYFDNNFLNLNYFSNFLFKNNYSFSDEIPMVYNKTTNFWSSILRYNDKFNKESWKFIVDFGCINEPHTNTYYWKFSILFSRFLNGLKKDSRLLVTVPSKFVCTYSKDNIFSFEYNLNNNYLFFNLESYYDSFYFIDNIGIFTSSYWNLNPKIVANITTEKIKKRINKKSVFFT